MGVGRWSVNLCDNGEWVSINCMGVWRGSVVILYVMMGNGSLLILCVGGHVFC